MAGPPWLVVPPKTFIIAKRKYGVPAGLSGMARHFFELPDLHQKGWRSLPISTEFIVEADLPKKGSYIWSVRVVEMSVTAIASAPNVSRNWSRLLLQPRLPPATTSRLPRFRHSQPQAL